MWCAAISCVPFTKPVHHISPFAHQDEFGQKMEATAAEEAEGAGGALQHHAAAAAAAHAAGDAVQHRGIAAAAAETGEETEVIDITGEEDEPAGALETAALAAAPPTAAPPGPAAKPAPAPAAAAPQPAARQAAAPVAAQRAPRALGQGAEALPTTAAAAAAAQAPHEQEGGDAEEARERARTSAGGSARTHSFQFISQAGNGWQCQVHVNMKLLQGEYRQPEGDWGVRLGRSKDERALSMGRRTASELPAVCLIHLPPLPLASVVFLLPDHPPSPLCLPQHTLSSLPARSAGQGQGRGFPKREAGGGGGRPGADVAAVRAAERRRARLHAGAPACKGVGGQRCAVHGAAPPVPASRPAAVGCACCARLPAQTVLPHPFVPRLSRPLLPARQAYGKLHAGDLNFEPGLYGSDAGKACVDRVLQARGSKVRAWGQTACSTSMGRRGLQLGLPPACLPACLPGFTHSKAAFLRA